MANEYAYKRTPDGEFVLECESCGVEAPLHTYSMGAGTYAVDKELCELCACSMAGNITHYHEQYDPSTVEIARVIAAVGNLVIDEITGRDPSKPQVK